jgi:hypothetical protein
VAAYHASRCGVDVGTPHSGLCDLRVVVRAKLRNLEILREQPNDLVCGSVACVVAWCGREKGVSLGWKGGHNQVVRGFHLSIMERDDLTLGIRSFVDRTRG